MKDRAWLLLVLGMVGMTGVVAARSHAAADEPKQAKAAAAPPTVLTCPADLKWTEGGAELPGAKVARLYGHPDKAALFVVRAKLPAHYRLPPHWHASDENVTVLSGAIYVGRGATSDASAAKMIAAGGFFSVPAQADHYLFTKTETTIQLTAVGPFGMMYVHPADDPSKTAVANTTTSTAPASKPGLHKASVRVEH
jgi:quercetin dioxygenase-like cupin family protein